MPREHHCEAKPDCLGQSGDDLEQVWLLPCIFIPEKP